MRISIGIFVLFFFDSFVNASHVDFKAQYLQGHPMHKATCVVVHHYSKPCVLHTCDGTKELHDCFAHSVQVKTTLDRCLRCQGEPYTPVQVITFHDEKNVIIAGPYDLTSIDVAIEELLASNNDEKKSE